MIGESICKPGEKTWGNEVFNNSKSLMEYSIKFCPNSKLFVAFRAHKSKVSEDLRGQHCSQEKESVYIIRSKTARVCN